MKGAKTPLREIRLRLFGCAVICLLSFDVINPVKICSEVLDIHTGWFFLISLLFSVSIVWGNVNDLVYFFTKIFFKSILSIFFSSIEVRNAAAHLRTFYIRLFLMNFAFRSWEKRIFPLMGL